MITPSQFPRIKECPDSEALPHVAMSWKHLRKGQALHEFLRRVSVDGHEAALEWLAVERPDLLQGARAVDVSRLPAGHPEAYAAEVSIAWDPETGEARELGRGLEREDAIALCPPGWILMTSDSVGVGAQEVMVYDYKTGWGHVDEAQDNWQLRLYGLGFAALMKRPKAFVGIIRVPAEEGTDAWFDTARLDEFNLMLAAEKVREVLAQVEEAKARIAAGGQPRLTVGEHCARCPAFSYCPAQVSLLRSLVVPEGKEGESIEQLVRNFDSGMTPAEFPRAWALLRGAEHVLKALTRAARTYAEQQGPIDIGDGWYVGRTERAAEVVDPPTVKEVLTEMYGPDVAAAAVKSELTATKASIERALRPVKESRKGATYREINEGVLRRLRELGGVEPRRWSLVTEFRRKEDGREVLT